MKSALLSLLILLASVSLFAQQGNAEQKAAMQKLKWLVGTWYGTSTVQVDSIRQVTNIRESIATGLDGTILLINVWATDKDSTTKRQSLAYSAFSVISYDTKNDKYRWTTWRNSGDPYDEHSFKVGDNSFEYITDENDGKVRYKARLGEKGEFLETGEYSKNGDSWGEFITMKLYKRKS